jgi:hypothetical protein
MPSSGVDAAGAPLRYQVDEEGVEPCERCRVTDVVTDGDRVTGVPITGPQARRSPSTPGSW